MGNYYGYTRASTKGQSTERGRIEIEHYCIQNNVPLSKVYTDNYTGTSFERPWYTILKSDILREGDTLIITELDRFGRSKNMILDELRYMRDHKIRVWILEIPTTLINYDLLPDSQQALIYETVSNIFIELYSSMAEAEMMKRKKRQQEGYEKMRSDGRWNEMGRRRLVDKKIFARQFQRVLNGEIAPFTLIEELGIAKSTYYKYRKEYFEMYPDECEGEKKE